MAYQGDYQAKVNHFLGLGCQVNEDECESIYKLTREIIHSNESVPESFVILGLEKIARVSTHYRGLALLLLAEYFHEKSETRLGVAIKHAISVLRLMTELFPTEAENFYALGQLYWLDCHSISRKEALDSFKKSYELGKKESAHWIWKTLLLDPKKEDEKEFLYYLTRDLEKYTSQKLWDERQEKDILNKICVSPSIWIYNLEAYSKRNQVVTHFLVELFIKNRCWNEALDLLEWQLRDNMDCNMETLLKYAVIGELLEKRSFVLGLCKYGTKVEHGKEIAYLFYKSQRVLDKETEVVKVLDNDIPVWIRYFDNADLITPFLIEKYCSWLFECNHKGLLFYTTLHLSEIIIYFARLNEIYFYVGLTSQITSHLNPKFEELCEHILFSLIDKYTKPKDVVNIIVSNLGEASFAKYVSYGIEKKISQVSWNYLVEVIRSFPWFKKFEPKVFISELSEYDIELIGLGSPDVCRKSYFKVVEDTEERKEVVCEILKRAAESGDVCCMDALACEYYFGKNIEKSLALEVFWRTAAAVNGDFDAQACLGYDFMCAPFNENKVGLRFIEKSVTNNSEFGKYLLAKSKVFGWGCNKDLANGLVMMEKLASENNQFAKEWLVDWKSKEQERLQKEQAEREAKEKARIEDQKKAEAAAAARAQQEKLRKQALAAKKVRTDRYICLDTETTGLSDVYDRVCEIAAVEFDPVTFEILSRFRVYINPQKSMPSQAYSIHGLSDAFLRDKPIFKGIVNQFLQYIRGAHVYIHNASYDKKMLNAELQRVSLYPLERYCKGVHCTLRAAVKLRGRGGNRLDDLCDDYRINRSKRTNHGALIDCELLVEVMHALKDHGATFEGMK